MQLTKLAGSAGLRAVTMFGLLGVILGGCSGDNFEREQASIIKAAQHQVGSSPDFVLTKLNYGVNDPIALVFGMASDIEFCMELADMYMRKYPGDTYVCLPAKGYQLPE